MSRSKKSRSLKGKLAKTGTKEMMKEQKKARKAASPTSRFDAKKIKQRKEQALRKLERQGLLPEPEAPEPKVRPKRFTFTPKPSEIKAKSSTSSVKDSEELTQEELLDALTEQN
ncbi:hypothetical protein DN730_02640 [Marinomonas piezotolerans]|uniref:Uncharacterized protein n=1 Tax=Marinomonas piezotolerans TaxID=2213058 RepID=A0A370UDW6_9GAMM|nr:hypothetical protein [Marinomonas piezotolerans]RDL45959.1 hypothetical protein DN730_02640 [Marinomonas piezotolerans]